MFFVLEGPDAGGKSELAARAAAHYGAPVVKTGPSGLWLRSLPEFARTLYDRPADRPDVVFDRWASSEWLYGPIFRRDARLTDVEHALLLRLLFARDGVLVVCLPPYQVCEETWRTDPKPVEGAAPDEAMFRRAFCAWRKFAEIHADLVWDYTADGPVEELWRRVFAFRWGKDASA